jgi:preprotein translocase subunit SecG
VIAYVLYTVFVIACLILILVVLLQPGKGDIASALGGGVSGAALGPRGATSLLAKITIGAAVAFMTLAFLFSIPGVITSRSVTSGLEAPEEAAEQPETPPPAEGTAPPEGGTPIPAGQITTDEEGKIPAQPVTPVDANGNPIPAEAPKAPEQKGAGAQGNTGKPEDKAPEQKNP